MSDVHQIVSFCKSVVSVRSRRRVYDLRMCAASVQPWEAFKLGPSVTITITLSFVLDMFSLLNDFENRNINH